MKHYIFILSIIALAFLPSCYESGYLETDGEEIKGLWTLPPEISGDSITLRGEYSDFSTVNVFYQLSRSKDIVGSTIARYRLGGDQIGKNRLNGTYFYRICAVSGPDTVFAPNVESFTLDNTISTNLEVTPTTANLTFTSIIRSATAQILISKDGNFSTADNLNVNFIKNQDGMYEYSAEVRNLTPNTTYYVMASLEVVLGRFDSDVLAFTTPETPEVPESPKYLKFGDVTYTDWDGTVYPMEDRYVQFRANYLTINSGVTERNFDVVYSMGEWKASRDILPVSGSTLVGFYSNTSLNNNDEIVIRTQDNLNNFLLWGSGQDYNGEVSVNFRNQMSRVVLHLSLSEDYPESLASIKGFNISGELLPTTGIFNVNSGRFVLDERSYSNPMVYPYDIKMEKGRTVDITVYSLPCSNCNGKAVFNFMYGEVASPMVLDWKPGNTYEYNMVFRATGLSVSDPIVNPWQPTEGGTIIINPKQ